MTQKELVKKVAFWKQLSITEIAKETWILEPNVRRILGQGSKTWEFKRIARGVYTIETKDEVKAIVKVGDALEEIKNLEGYKFDMVFLDIPYKTAAVIGWSRGVKYDLISPDQFEVFLEDLKVLLKNEETPVYYMYSNAPSWKKQMDAYNSKMEKVWFKKIASGTWTKLFQNWKLATNMRGNEMPPEGIDVFSLSWNIQDLKLDFVLPKTRTASQKPLEMLKTFIKQSTKEKAFILDPFAGSWITWRAALELVRNIFLIEKSEERVQNEILPILQF